MHYGKSSFSKNGKPTIQAVKNASRSLGQRKGFTSMDIREINALYDCGSKCVICARIQQVANKMEEQFF